MELVRCVLAAVVVAVLACGVVEGQVPDENGEVTYRVTFRNFIPSSCMKPEAYAAAWEIDESDYSGLKVWDVDELPETLKGGDDNFALIGQFYSGNSNSDRFKGNLLAKNYCAYYSALKSGEVLAHPDFETSDNDFGTGCNEIGGSSSRAFNCSVLNPRVIQNTLRRAPSGLLKPIYCDESSETARCGHNKPDDEWTSSNFGYFKSWYNDDARFNKRIGQKIVLGETSSGSEQYEFDSASEPTGNFHPFDIYRGVVNASRFPDWRDAPVWPNFHLDWQAEVKPPLSSGLGRTFGFTTELQTFFRYDPDNAVFTFAGDDDTWVFIDGKVALNLGGLHSPVERTVDLAQVNIDEGLGLIPDQTYEFSMFHAERHFSASNFKLTSTLAAGCNVLGIRSGLLVFDAAEAGPGDFVASTNAEVDASTGGLTLSTNSSSPASPEFVYLKQRQNVGRGFVASFNFSVSEAGLAEGFAFVLHRRDEGLEDLPVSSGSGLGYRFLKKSVAVVFDMCTDRSTGTCTQQMVSVNYPNSTSDRNGPGNEVVYDSVTRSLRVESETHVVSIEYLANPSWLEVYIDDSLYLRVIDFDPEEVLGGRDAFVGFTTATSQQPVDMQITGLQIKTVSVDPGSTVAAFDLSNVTEPVELLADGTDANGLAVQTRDFCGDIIEFGGFSDIVQGIFVERPVAAEGVDEEEGNLRRFLDEDARNQTYGDGRMMPVIQDALIIDNDDGTYSVALSTDIPGDFDMYVCVGNGTGGFVIDDFTDPVTNFTATEVSFAGCAFNLSVPLAARVIPLTERPTRAPVTLPPTLPADTSQSVLISAVAGGSAFFLFVLVAAVLLVFRRRWQRDKAFIEQGQLYAMEREVTYDKNDEYGVVGRMVLQTTAAIQRERAQKGGEGGDAIVTLKEENDELREEVRLQKMKAQQGGAGAAMAFRRAANNNKKKKNKKEFAAASDDVSL